MNNEIANKKRGLKSGREGNMMGRRIKTLLFVLGFYLLTVPFVFALDFTLLPGGFVFIPLGTGSTDPDTGNEMYNVGGGGELGFETDLSTIWPNSLGLGYSFGIEAAMLMNQLKSEKEQNISFYHAGGNLGAFYFPISRLLTRLDGAAGVFMFAG